MISRPLDLSSKLTPAPRDWDWVYFVNVGLLVLYFLLFGSRFVLAPGLGTDFRMPVMPAAREGAAMTTHVINVRRGGLIYTESGNMSMQQLREWLANAVKGTKNPVLLMCASDDVAYKDLVEIDTAARAAGFAGIVWGGEAPHTAKQNP